MSISVAKERAAKGAAWLDKYDPQWFTKVNPDSLNIADAEKCVLGQLVGDYYDSPLRARWFGRDKKFGFMGDFLAARSHELTQAWRDEIQRRRATNPATN